ncbi:unnamed protein product [Phaedon cochleariae]|uniref:Uncharacterized protein n=1 Tax=Phaedon cochleariae TaxID=80249 RepID=A0A9P0GKM1_PHACE|nr:unnamed protein product [Phaedon cochleariae]
MPSWCVPLSKELILFHITERKKTVASITVCLVSMLATQVHCSCLCDCSNPFLHQTQKLYTPYFPQEYHDYNHNQWLNFFQQPLGNSHRDLRVKPQQKPKVLSYPQAQKQSKCTQKGGCGNVGMEMGIKEMGMDKVEMKMGMGGIKSSDGGMNKGSEMKMAMGGMKMSNGGMKMDSGLMKMSNGGMVMGAVKMEMSSGGMNMASEKIEMSSGGMGNRDGGMEKDNGKLGGNDGKKEQEKKPEIPKMEMSGDKKMNSVQQVSPMKMSPEVDMKVANKEEHEDHHHHYDYEDDKNIYYKFGYAVNDKKTHDIKYQKEERKGDVITGEYAITEEDGNVRTVKYVADWKNGFKAQVLNSKEKMGSLLF